MTAELVKDVLEKIDEIIIKQESLKGFKNETIELATENYEYKITKHPLRFFLNPYIPTLKTH